MDKLIIRTDTDTLEIEIDEIVCSEECRYFENEDICKICREYLGPDLGIISVKEIQERIDIQKFCKDHCIQDCKDCPLEKYKKNEEIL